jgi:conflict system pore-forming effector with SLATT domain
MANSQTQREACLSELAHLEEDALYSAKGHFEAGRAWQDRHQQLGLPAAIISGIAGVSALSTFDHHNIIAGVLALVAASLGSVNAFLNPAERASHHHNFGNDYNSLRNQARVVATIEAHSLADNELKGRVVDLSSLRDQLNKKAPQIPRKAFERARKGIEEGEATYADG